MSAESKKFSTHELQYEGVQSERLDKALVDMLSSEPAIGDVSRSRLKSAIEAGHVTVDGELVTKASHLLVPGACVVCKIDEPEPQELVPWKVALDIVFEDEHLLVVNKPAGMTVHPGAGNANKTLANALMAYFEGSSQESPPRVGIVHRLDKDTTGLLVVAKTTSIHSALTQSLKERKIKRSYRCLVMVTPRAKRLVQRESSGTIETFIGRHLKRRTCMQVLENSGRKAVTHWERVSEFGYACEMKIRLETGRTHQIRVHMDHVNSPVVGDQSYGDFSALPQALHVEVKKFGRQALHACELVFTHPATGELVSIAQDPPQDYLDLLELFREFGQNV